MIKDILLHDYSIKYWKIRDRYLRSNNSLVRYILYVWLKRIESKCNSDMGTSYHDPCALFLGHPILPHGLNGIVISRHASIGREVTIFHQVTIGIRGENITEIKAPVIGNGVMIGAGAKVLGNITIGDNVRIGANAVVTKNIENGCTVVGFNRIIKK